MKITIPEKIYNYSKDESHSNKLAVADSKKSLSYSELWSDISGFSDHLSSLGLSKGDFCLLHCSQNVEYITALFALQLLGAIPVPVEDGAGAERIDEMLNDTGAKFFITHKVNREDIKCISMEEALLHSDNNQNRTFDFSLETDTAEILFSTGTTGKSKGIELTHSSNTAIAENVIQGVNMSPDNIELVPMPLSHSHGIRRAYANFYNGSSVVLINGVMQMKIFYELMDRYHVTAIDMSPSILNIIFKLSKDRIGNYKDSLDYIQIGSAALTEEDKEHLSSLLPNTRLYNFYGTTESGCSCILDFNEMKNIKGCIGRPAVNAKFIFVDENRNPVNATAENPGFIATSGAINMKGYFKAKELTDSVMANGFIYTNDLGYTDESGLIYYIGRSDDVINCAGVKISPDEIEKTASDFPGIKDCACIPIADKIQGQVPKLIISLEDISLADDLSGFKNYLKEKLDGNKYPKKIEIIDEVPRTSNGKLQRKKLIEREKSL
ncbi:class I adenylate-forming enzyme family protein [Lachnospiraceae bacterium C1.1]|nr:class I adenylate-forming enzyme family protein [Lachnospiraceae bacterium C1.1]